MKDMSQIYYNMPSDQLRRLRSRKAVELRKIQATPKSYWQAHDIRRLDQHLMWIDAVLASREYQPGLFS